MDKLVGDEVIGLYIPGIAGPDHARRAIDAGKELPRATGRRKKSGPWVPVGIGVRAGDIYLGAVGAEGTFTDVSMLGDPVNVTARLASQAATGEILVSDETSSRASYDVGSAETRDLSLKGRDESVNVSVLYRFRFKMTASSRAKSRRGLACHARSTTGLDVETVLHANE